MKLLKIILSLIALIITTIGIVIMVTMYKDYSSPRTHYYYNDTTQFVRFKSGKVCLKNSETNQYITPKFDRIFLNFANPITVYKIGSKRGYFNQETGEILIDAKNHNFSYAWEFDHKSGLAAVVENGMMGFIDERGEYKIKPQFNYSYTVFSHLGFLFKNGFCLIPGENGNVGIINTSGSIILEPNYSWISNENDKRLRVVYISETKKSGLVDSSFSLVLPVEYDEIELSDEGIFICENQGKRLVSYSDFEKVITKQIWDEISPLYYQLTGSSSENCSKMFSGFYRVELNNKYGAIDTQGKLCIHPNWDNIYCLNPSLFEATLNNNSMLINANGEFVD